MTSNLFRIPAIVAEEAMWYTADSYVFAVDSENAPAAKAARGWYDWTINLDDVRDAAAWYYIMKSALDGLTDPEHVAWEKWGKRPKETRAKYEAIMNEVLASVRTLLEQHGATPEMLSGDELWERQYRLAMMTREEREAAQAAEKEAQA